MVQISRRKFVGGAAVTLTTLAMGGSAAAMGTMPVPASNSPVVGSMSARVALYGRVRTLFDQHMQWTYDTVVAFAAASPGLTATLNRILRNQTEIASAFAPYYGDSMATQLGNLLTTHIQEAVPVLQAAQAGNADALKPAVDAWYANAQDLGDFMASMNPAWPQADMREMWKEHITQTIGYASDILTGNYEQAIAGYDAAQTHMDEMSDMLSAGIIAQFPDKFSLGAPPPDDTFAPAQAAQPKPGSMYFKETQHNLSAGFGAYWKEYGGLATYGYPLTEEFVENGVTVQYFERARFEWHPGSDAERFDIELGRLGAEQLDARYGSNH